MIAATEATGVTIATDPIKNNNNNDKIIDNTDNKVIAEQRNLLSNVCESNLCETALITTYSRSLSLTELILHHWSRTIAKTHPSLCNIDSKISVSFNYFISCICSYIYGVSSYWARRGVKINLGKTKVQKLSICSENHLKQTSKCLLETRKHNYNKA